MRSTVSKGRRTGQQFVERDPEGVDVGPFSGLCA